MQVADDAAAEQLLCSLRQNGYSIIATVEQERVSCLATARLEAPGGSICDLIFATSGIEPELIASSTPIDVPDAGTLPVASPESLLAMKSDDRPQDLGDIRAILLASPNLDKTELSRFLALITQRGYHRGQDLPAKWKSLKAKFAIG